MKKTLKISFFILFIFAIKLFPITPPQDFFGFLPGKDYKLVRYDEVVDYFKKLSSETEKLKLYNLGKTTLGNSLYMVVLSSEENIKNLDNILNYSKEVFFPKDTSREYLENLKKNSKVVIAITMNLHSVEIASSQTAPRLVYEILTDKRFNKILDDVVLLIFPSTNPDGQILVTNWYRKTLGTELEGTFPPELYHYYAGHDNNRDWYYFNLKETWLVSKILYHEFFPQILVDEHQMGMYGARLFVPPYIEPITPSVHPLIWRYIDSFGNYTALELQRYGKKGVAKKILFQGAYIGATDDTLWLHNGIGILFESASTKLATPVFVDKSELKLKWGENEYEKTIDFPDPWKGGWWRLNDIVEYQLVASKTIIKYAKSMKNEIIEDISKIALEQVKKGNSSPPYAFVVRDPFKDRGAVYKLVDMLMKGGVKVEVLKENTVIDDVILRKGSIVIKTAQPYRPYILELLQVRKFPEKYEPYDFSTWSVPPKLGLKLFKINRPAELKTEKIEDSDEILKVKNRDNENFKFLCFSPENIFSYKLLNAVFKSKNEIYFDKDKELFIVKNKKSILELGNKLGIKFNGCRNNSKIRVKKKRIGVFSPSLEAMDEGWLRWTLDEFGFAYERIKPDNFEKKIKKIDVLIFPNISSGSIESGFEEIYIRYFGEGIKKLAKGIGKKGKEALKVFLKNGGEIIFIGNSLKYVTKNLGLPVRVSDSKGIKVNGSIVKAIKEKSLYTVGLGKKVNVFLTSPLVLSTSIPFSGKNVSRRVYLRIPEKGDILVSGFIKGEKKLYRAPLFVEVKKGKGKVILISFSPHLRGQTWETFRLLFNPLIF